MIIQPSGLPSFRPLPIASQNVSRQCRLLILLLHILSLSPALLGIIYNIKAAYDVPNRDAGGPLVLGNTQTDYWVANLWCVLAGYWSWTLSTSMIRRWLYHYEIINAIFRLITLMALNWSISAYLQNLQDPITIWMSASGVLLVGTLLKLTLASNPKYSRKADAESDLRLHSKSTIVRVLVLPLFFVTCCTLWATIYEIGKVEYRSSELMEGVQLDTTIQTKQLVLVMSSWTEQGRQRRQAMRETTLQWLPNDSYRFVLGKPPSASAQMKYGQLIVQESSENHDMLIVPSSDIEQDKSHKVLEALRWASSVDYEYLIKTEDDMFVRWDLLTSELIALGPKAEYWRGLAYRNMPPSDDSKLAMNTDYGMPILPAYTSGSLYVISHDVADWITRAKTVVRYIARDDQNLAVWLFGHTIKPIHDPRIQENEVCEDDLLAMRVGGGDRLQTMYGLAKQGRSQCSGGPAIRSCSVCYPCHKRSDDWRSYNLECDPVKGITLHNQPLVTKIADQTVKDQLEKSRLGENDAWIIPNVLSQRTSVYSDNDWDLIYWVCWTSDPSTFTDRHWRALELVWIHQPRAVIFMISNTLSTDFFKDYISRGYKIHVVHIDKENLLNWHWYFGPGTLDWLQDWERWENESFFYWHLTDYVRLYLLYSYGGTYMDMDALWLRAPPDPNLEFIGSDYSSVWSDREWTLNDKNLYLPQGLMRFKRGWTLFREMAESSFSSYAYDPKCFNCHGPKAITSYVREHRAPLEAANFTILPRHVLYPASYLEIYKYLLPNPKAEAELKSLESWNIHLFGKMTNSLDIQPGSIIDVLFKRFDLGRHHPNGSWQIMGPSQHLYHTGTWLDAPPGRFQGLDTIYIRGDLTEARLEIEIAYGELQVGTQPWKDRTTHSQQEINKLLNQLTYSPSSELVTKGGRDLLVVRVVSGNKVQEAKIEVIIPAPQRLI
ncbi:galactosyltransferase-domain-containing protein [Phycomyces blakesleeanus]